MKSLNLFLCSLLLISVSQAGVYGDLEFGDSRETVTRKLRNSALVTQTIDNTFVGRTGLNGIYQCKAKLAGLTCLLFFNWDENGGLNEITLRSDGLSLDQYDGELLRASNEAAQKLYANFGFKGAAVRREYYDSPVEDAVMMTLEQGAFEGLIKRHEIL